jgi:hypothetical protein
MLSTYNATITGSHQSHTQSTSLELPGWSCSVSSLIWLVAWCSSYVSIAVEVPRSPEVPIDAQWLTNERCCTGIAQRPIEDLTSPPTRCVITDDLLIHHHPERPAAEEIQDQDHCRPADPFPQPAPGILLLPFLNFGIHAASLGIIGASAQLKSCGMGSIN